MNSKQKSYQEIKAPDFINVGPGRSGTSWLLEMLEQHPEIALSKIKETEYFNTNYDKGEKWYLKHFPNNNKVIGEISNMYFSDLDVAKRIYDYNPDIKIIFNLRKPISLLNSISVFGVRRGLDPKNPGFFNTPIGKTMGTGYHKREREDDLKSGDLVPISQAPILSRFLKPYIDLFGKENIYFLIFERISEEPEQLLSELYDFLNVSPTFKPSNSEEVINGAIVPKIKLLGLIATRISFLLRALGAYRTLRKLHKSRILKKIFYRKKIEKTNVPSIKIPEKITQALEEEEKYLISQIPNLKKYWT